MMQAVKHTANSRGFADHGWLKSHHSFSFASYYNPDRLGFGALRVLNDDLVEGGKGFGTHPHANMEIVSIPLLGALRHKDSEGNQHVISAGEVQIMSAGTGIQHSEYNHSDDESVNFLQIWILPKEKDIKPRYQQKRFDIESRKNEFVQVVAPLGTNSEAVEINQDSHFSLVELEAGRSASYKLKDLRNGLYLFLIEGSGEAAGQKLVQRDALAIADVSSVEFKAEEDSRLLAIEIPLT